MSDGRSRGVTGWTTGGRLRVLVLMCWAMLLLVSVTAVWFAEVQSNNIRQLTLINGPARTANDEVRQAMTEAQNGLTAYQFTKDRTLLQSYAGSRERTLTALATLQAKLALGAEEGDDGAQRKDLAGRQRLAAEKWWANALSLQGAVSRGERTDLRQSHVLFGSFLELNTSLGGRLVAALEQSRAAAQDMASRGKSITIAIALMALIAMLLLGGRIARTISLPLSELRDTMVRQREGDLGARAREDQGSSEIRAVAGVFNTLTEQDVTLRETQTLALEMNEITFGIGRAMRAASDTQQALDVACAELGERLSVDRVVGNTFDVDNKERFGAQWHRPELLPVGDFSVIPELEELAEELWQANELRARDDLFVEALQSWEPVRIFCRITGARASIMAPIGFGDRVIGMIYVLMVGGPRAWSDSEANVVQAVAGFAARAIVAADNEEHRREYVQRVEKLDRQKSDFLATVSHELRTPLTSIRGYLELLQDQDVGELTAQQLGMLEVIGRNTARLRSLIEDVMVLSRIEGGVTQGNFVAVSIPALITRVSQELMPLTQKNAVKLEVDPGPAAADVLGDKATLDRAVVNVLSNAIKFSRPGGVVTIRGSLDESAGRVRITCEDHGVGVPAHDQADLFTRFFRASNAMSQAIPGTGLGLSIVKQIIEDHGGDLRLTSVEDEGTTVVMDLAWHEPARARARETPGNGSHLAAVLDKRA